MCVYSRTGAAGRAMRRHSYGCDGNARARSERVGRASASFERARRSSGRDRARVGRVEFIEFVEFVEFVVVGRARAFGLS